MRPFPPSRKPQPPKCLTRCERHFWRSGFRIGFFCGHSGFAPLGKRVKGWQPPESAAFLQKPRQVVWSPLFCRGSAPLAKRKAAKIEFRFPLCPLPGSCLPLAAFGSCLALPKPEGGGCKTLILGNGPLRSARLPLLVALKHESSLRCGSKLAPKLAPGGRASPLVLCIIKKISLRFVSLYFPGIKLYHSF